jgi:hypothetical protein
LEARQESGRQARGQRRKKAKHAKDIHPNSQNIYESTTLEDANVSTGKKSIPGTIGVAVKPNEDLPPFYEDIIEEMIPENLTDQPKLDPKCQPIVRRLLKIPGWKHVRNRLE